jgi:hypothetical protein
VTEVRDKADPKAGSLALDHVRAMHAHRADEPVREAGHDHEPALVRDVEALVQPQLPEPRGHSQHDGLEVPHADTMRQVDGLQPEAHGDEHLEPAPTVTAGPCEVDRRRRGRAAQAQETSTTGAGAALAMGGATGALRFEKTVRF